MIPRKVSFLSKLLFLEDHIKIKDLMLHSTPIYWFYFRSPQSLMIQIVNSGCRFLRLKYHQCLHPTRNKSFFNFPISEFISVFLAIIIESVMMGKKTMQSAWCLHYNCVVNSEYIHLPLNAYIINKDD